MGFLVTLCVCYLPSPSQVLAPAAAADNSAAAGASGAAQDDNDDDVKAFMPQPESSKLDTAPQRSGNLLMTEASGALGDEDGNDDGGAAAAAAVATPRKLAVSGSAKADGGEGQGGGSGPAAVAEGTEREVEAVQMLLGQLLAQDTELVQGGMAVEEVTGDE